MRRIFRYNKNTGRPYTHNVAEEVIMKFFPLKFTVEEPPAPKKKSKKGALITFAVALLILLASGALFLARLRKRRRAAEVAEDDYYATQPDADDFSEEAEKSAEAEDATPEE